MAETLADGELAAIDSYWRARLLRYWETTPGLNFIYVHLDRVNAKRSPTRSIGLYSRAGCVRSRQSHMGKPSGALGSTRKNLRRC
jgi:phosphoketolase